jgi:threonine dehydrogenase-like Zn-dependent dehydrogenase
MANQQDLSDLVTHRLLLSEAAEGFAMFEKQLARKVVLVI